MAVDYDEPYSDEEYWDEECNEPICYTCGGDGWVDSVAQTTGR